MKSRKDTIDFFRSFEESLAPGLYKSTKTSYRTNYYLNVFKDSVTLYGWESNGKEIIYYRTSTKIVFHKNKTYDVKFNVFEFSHDSIQNNKVGNFLTDKKLSIEPLFLHNSFQGEIYGKKLIMSATKDCYDSRADQFEFILL